MRPARASAAEGPEPGSLSQNIDCIGVFQSIYTWPILNKNHRIRMYNIFCDSSYMNVFVKVSVLRGFIWFPIIDATDGGDPLEALRYITTTGGALTYHYVFFLNLGKSGACGWEVVESRFHVDLKSNFALKNNSMEFLLGPITWRINVLYESQMKWTWHHSKLAVEEVSFFGGLRVVLLQLLSIHDWAVGVTDLGVALLWYWY